jgi:RNA polymerase sigma-70 factor, ECF subfamily
MNENALTDTALDTFNNLVMEYQQTIYNHACWMLNNPDEAEDITQEVFITAYHKLDTCRNNTIKSWLLRITTNRCIDVIRRRKRRWTTPLDIEDEDGEVIESNPWLKDPCLSPEMQAEQSQQVAAVQQHLSMLPDEVRTALVLVDVMEIDYQEAAKILNVPIGTLKSRVSRGRTRLLDRMQSSERRSVRPAYQFCSA